jgi:hypothetical protein
VGLYLIAAAKDPAANRSLISFTIWSSVVHAAIMAVQALAAGNTAIWSVTFRPCSSSQAPYSPSTPVALA